MTESTDTALPDTAVDGSPRKRGGLNGMRVADLKAMAGGLGIAGADGMRKPQLVEAIKAAQGQGTSRPTSQQPATTPESPAAAPAAEAPASEAPASEEQRPRVTKRERSTRRVQPQAEPATETQAEVPPTATEQAPPVEQVGRGRQQGRQQRGQDQPKQDQPKQDQPKQDQQKQDQPKQDQQERKQRQQQDQQQKQQDPKQQDQGQQDAGDDQSDDGTGSRRNRRRRGRDNREAPQRTQRRNEPDTQVLEDDVLVPAAGILDVLENYAFVRTSGYLPGTDDVYLSLSLVRKFGLRRGDAVKGQVRQPRDGERREKFNPMVRIDSVNGADPDAARTRPEYDELTPVHPTQRIRLETGAEDLTGRVLDLVAPLGKGQRCLVRAAPRAAKGALLRSLAASVSTNCPEAHLMVVLLHERPEEITDVRRAVAGEVIASGFDRQPADHVGVAELAVERAKRLVELGHDVVVLLDGLTRLARAHHHAGGAAGGRTAGLDVTALLPPKQFFGAARALEEGGSLTVVATVPVDTGSEIDRLVLEELEDTANAEVHLPGDLADADLVPAVDPLVSGTRHEELLLGAEELHAVRAMRAGLARSDGPQAALTALLDKLRASRTNIELLTRQTKGTGR